MVDRGVDYAGTYTSQPGYSAIPDKANLGIRMIADSLPTFSSNVELFWEDAYSTVEE